MITQENLTSKLSDQAARHSSDASFQSTARTELLRAVHEACSRIPPLWPLRRFVAVNPFVGLGDFHFDEACALIRKVGRGELLMPAGFYLEQVESGHVTPADIDRAWYLTDSGERQKSASELIDVLRRSAHASPSPVASIETLADAIDRERGSEWAAFVVEEISKWCAAYFDQGQSSWTMPWRHLSLYAAWKQAAQLDYNPEAAGIPGFRAAVATLPDEPWELIALAVDELDLSAGALTDFLHREPATISGWSAYARFRVWESEMRGERDDALIHLLAVRLAWDVALNRVFRPKLTGRTFQPAQCAAEGSDLRIRALMQLAYELADQRRLMQVITSGSENQAAASPVPAPRKAAQAVFCIDVRSEVYRRALETVSRQVDTIGFAGFFGFPIEYVPLAHEHGEAHCPVLLSPGYRVRETLKDASVHELLKVYDRRWLHKRTSAIWKAFKQSAVSCFSYVEVSGLLYGLKLLTDSLGLTRPVLHPATAGVSPRHQERIGPTVTRQRGRLVRGGAVRETGIALSERVNLAQAALKGMGLTCDFARLVLLCGHASHTVNNPYGSALDCGACGGHSGEANARIAATILNDRDVRAALAAQGLRIPRDTWFVAGLHDTTTDEVRLFDLESVPHGHEADVAQLQSWLNLASRLARGERADLLGLGDLSPFDLSQAVEARCRDWSQVRPEWGLAGNRAFIAAPRERTRKLVLNGQAFLHEYSPEKDPGGAILELIMTAPLVVASWINLQYYASTVDNRSFGSGNKTLHNVVATLGVFEGNGGDFRTGLPWQSLHDGSRLVHEPLRLSAIIEAEEDAIERVIAKHESLRQLINNQWLHLFRIVPGGADVFRRRGPGNWVKEITWRFEA